LRENKWVVALQHDTYILLADLRSTSIGRQRESHKEKAMSFRTDFPDFAAIESQVRAARVERAVAVSHALVAAGEAVVRGMKRLAASMGNGYTAERDRRAIEADAFLKRSVPRY
jgi:hypothetical protein